MTLKLVGRANRTAKINPFKVMDVLLRTRQLEAMGRTIVHMEVGEPDFSSPWPIIDAGHDALNKGYTQYSTAAGLPQLREAISEYYKRDYAVSINPERIFVTPGASGGLNLLSNLLVNPGDGILMADPAYPCNRNYVSLMGGEPQLLPVNADTQFQPSIEVLKRYQKDNSRGLWLASPANPTGTIVNAPLLKELSSWAAQQNLHVVMDEIYHGLQFVDDLPSLLQYSDQGFVVNSFSKYFGMTGWRVGWIVVPQAFISTVDILSQNLFIAASTISQYAALAAFTPVAREIMEQRRTEFMNRRDFLTAALIEIGFSIPVKTDGAFYIWAGIEKFSDNSEEFCSRLLEQHGVALTPGTDFGVNNANRFVRFAFTTNRAMLELGVERLIKALVG